MVLVCACCTNLLLKNIKSDVILHGYLFINTLGEEGILHSKKLHFYSDLYYVCVFVVALNSYFPSLNSVSLSRKQG